IGAGTDSPLARGASHGVASTDRPTGAALWEVPERGARRSDCECGGEAVRLVRVAVAEEAAEGCRESEDCLQHPRRGKRQLDRVEMCLGDRGKAERVRHALPVRLAVDGEREHRLEERLELQGGPDLADEANRLVAGVPEAVRHAGLDGGDVAGAQRQFLAAHLQPERAARDGEALALRRVNVSGGDEPVRLDDDLDHDRLAAGVGRGREERDALAGDGVLDCLACADHLCASFGVVIDTSEARSAGLKNRRPQERFALGARDELSRLRVSLRDDYVSPGWTSPDSYARTT